MGYSSGDSKKGAGLFKVPIAPSPCWWRSWSCHQSSVWSCNTDVSRPAALNAILLTLPVETKLDQSTFPLSFLSRLSRPSQACWFGLRVSEFELIVSSLHGLFGRKTGQVEGFQYTDANKQKGITWYRPPLPPQPAKNLCANIVFQGRRYSLYVPGESQEVHPRHQDGIRRPQEGEGPKWFDYLFEGEHSVNDYMGNGTFSTFGKKV